MKRFILTFLATSTLVFGGMYFAAHADTIGSLSPWQINNNTIHPIVTSSSVQVPSLGSANLCLITNASGTFSVASCGSGGSGSSTILYQGYAITLTPNPINTTGTVSVNTSTLTSYIATLGYLTSASGTAEFYPLSSNPSNFTTTTIQSVLNSLSAVGLATYNSSTGQFSVSSSTLNLGTASHYAFSDFLPSSTLYLATNTGNWAGTWQLYNPSDFLSSSTVYISTSTGNWQGTWKTYNPSDFLTSSTIYLSTTTGNWIGTWQGANSSTFYLASNPNHYVATSSLGTAALYNYTDFLPSSTIYIATNTGNWAGTWQLFNPSDFLSSSTAHLASYNVTSANSYISVSTTTTSAALTFSTSSFGSNAFTSTAIPTIYVSTFNGTSSAINFHDIGTGNVTTSVATSGGNTTTTISLTGVIPAANGGTATTTALGSNAFTSTAIPTNYYSTINGSAASGATSYNIYGGLGISVATDTASTTLTVNQAAALSFSALGNTTSTANISAATMQVNGTAVSTSTGANPTATISTSTQNGSANTFMRSDAAPAFSQSLAYTFSALGNTTSTANIGAATMHTSGAMTVSSTLTVAATTTFLGNGSYGTSTVIAGVNENHNYGGSTTTVLIGGSGIPLCIEGYDAVNSTTLEYFYASNATMVVTTTKPIFCY